MRDILMGMCALTAPLKTLWLGQNQEYGQVEGAPDSLPIAHYVARLRILDMSGYVRKHQLSSLSGGLFLCIPQFLAQIHPYCH
jgi:hypothetical protein